MLRTPLWNGAAAGPEVIARDMTYPKVPCGRRCWRGRKIDELPCREGAPTQDKDLCVFKIVVLCLRLPQDLGVASIALNDKTGNGWHRTGVRR